MSAEQLHRRHWSVDEFQNAVRLGVFREDEHLELIYGEIIEKMPPDPPHSITIPLSIAQLQAIFIPLNAHLRTENPLMIPGDGQPEPDILVVRGGPRNYLAQHPQPTDVLLLIEVSDSTLQTDRAVKGPLYAAAGISEYWILNLQNRQLEVHRTPLNGIWTSTFVIPATGTVTPLAAPNATIAIADLLP